MEEKGKKWKKIRKITRRNVRIEMKPPVKPGHNNKMFYMSLLQPREGSQHMLNIRKLLSDWPTGWLATWFLLQGNAKRKKIEKKNVFPVLVVKMAKVLPLRAEDLKTCSQ